MTTMTEALEHLEGMRRASPDWITEPMEPGETVPRQYMPRSYRAARAQVRDGAPIHWDDTATERERDILATVERFPVAGDPNWADAVRHFREAANPALSDEARTVHHDIAGKQLWDLLQVGSTPQGLWEAFGAWQAMGGT